MNTARRLIVALLVSVLGGEPAARAGKVTELPRTVPPVMSSPGFTENVLAGWAIQNISCNYTTSPVKIIGARVWSHAMSSVNSATAANPSWDSCSKAT